MKNLGVFFYGKNIKEITRQLACFGYIISRLILIPPSFLGRESKVGNASLKVQ